MNANQITENIKRMQRSIAGVQNRTIVMLIVIVIACYFRRHEMNQSEEIKKIRNSISKLYTEFDPAVFTDMSALKTMMEKIKKFSDEDLPQAEERLMKSEKLNDQIEMLKNFDIDKTGKADLALSSIGGKIAGIGSNTKFVYGCNFFWKLIGCPNKVNGPEKMIEPSMQPGECFRFKSNNATIFIRLANEAVLESVTIEHITKKLSPTGEVTEAPKTFSVSGMNSEHEEPFHFGTFIFNANKSSIETFKFKTKSSIAYRYIKVDFHENNGDPISTCVYRLRVHGVVLKSK